MTSRVFIDGGAGTTGLEIRERLGKRTDLTVIELGPEERRNPQARAAALNGSDIVILCLPDEAAREAITMIESDAVRVIDASSAHRTTPGWTYGFPELEPDRGDAVAASRRVSNPGCYPTGFLALIRPLVRAGLMARDLPLSVNAVSGYSGGGKAMIAAYEHPGNGRAPAAWQTYALGVNHKHLAEMRSHAGLDRSPIFAPSVAPTYRGMIVEVPLHLDFVTGNVATIRKALADSYAGCSLIRVADAANTHDLSTLLIEQAAGTDRLDLFVFANEATGQARLVAALDNLGKGAAGAAVQSLNLMIGTAETQGLRL